VGPGILKKFIAGKKSTPKNMEAKPKIEVNSIDDHGLMDLVGSKFQREPRDQGYNCRLVEQTPGNLLPLGPAGPRDDT